MVVEGVVGGGGGVGVGDGKVGGECKEKTHLLGGGRL